MQEGSSHLEEEFIRDERPCLFCGYSVRGLPARGKCPECGGSIAESCRSVLFLNASDARLRTIAGGVWLVNRLVLSAMTLLALAFAIAIGYSLLTDDDRRSQLLFLSGAIAALLLLLAAAVQWFRLMRPFPERDGVLPFARASRILLGAFSGTALLMAGLTIFEASDLIAGVLLAAAGVLLSLWMISAALVLREIAVRVADYWGWRRLRWAVGAAGLSGGLVLSFAFAFIMPEYPEVMAALYIPLTMIGLATVTLWAAITGDVLAKCARELRRVERYRSQMNAAGIGGGE